MRSRSQYVELNSNSPQTGVPPPTSLERFVRADQPESQNPLRRLVGRVCGVKPTRATELYLRREEAEDRNTAPPGYQSQGVVMPEGLGLDLDFDIEQGDRLARHLERGRLSR